jgi:ABC-type Fe3+/spermidine/putrescine transport system ATPase subunit
MSDEIIVMSKGQIQQKGGPHEIYAHPVNAYVSNFIGVANLLKGHVVDVTAPGQGKVEVAEGGMRVELPCKLGKGLGKGGEAVVSVRPENVRAERMNGGGQRLEGEVLDAIFLGNYVDCRVLWGAYEWKVIAHPRDRLRKGEKVYLRLDPDHTLAVQP